LECRSISCMPICRNGIKRSKARRFADLVYAKTPKGRPLCSSRIELALRTGARNSA